MGNTESKDNERDARCMEAKEPGLGEVAKIWCKKHGFKGKLMTEDLVLLGTKLQKEILSCKDANKKRALKKQYCKFEKWMEESERRDEVREQKKKTRKEKDCLKQLEELEKRKIELTAVMLQDDDETPCTSKTRGGRPGGNAHGGNAQSAAAATADSEKSTGPKTRSQDTTKTTKSKTKHTPTIPCWK